LLQGICNIKIEWSSLALNKYNELYGSPNSQCALPGGFVAEAVRAKETVLKPER
jgi:hypothetical protein